MRLGRLFKKRACAVAAAAALFLCLASANAGAQDIDDILIDIWQAILRDDGNTVVRLIRQNGIDINGNYYIRFIGRPGIDTGYVTALSCAMYEESCNVIKALLDAGADVNARNKENGKTALSIFAPTAYSNAETKKAAFRMLISAGADVNAQDDNGNTPLMGVSRDFVKILLDAGANVNIRNKDGLTALMIAEREGKAEMARLLRGARGYR